MSTRTRLAAFALVLGATFATGWGIGAAVGPLDDAPAPAPATSTTAQPGSGTAEEPAPVTPTSSTTAEHTEHGGAQR